MRETAGRKTLIIMKKSVIILILSGFLSAAFPATAQGAGPAWGIEGSAALASHSGVGGSYKTVFGTDSWELALYPLLGLEIFNFRLSAFAGGGLGLTFNYSKGTETTNGIEKDYAEGGLYWTYSFGGNLEALLGTWILGVGGGMTGSTIADTGLADSGKSPSPFIRVSLGIGDDFDNEFALKLYYDYNFDGGFNP
jgi:hypothetical protein